MYLECNCVFKVVKTKLSHFTQSHFQVNTIFVAMAAYALRLSKI